MRYFKKILGSRLYLSPMSKNDEDTKKYLKWMNEDVAKGFGAYNRIVSSVDDLKWLYDTRRDMHRYAIVLLERDLLIGSISIYDIDHLNRNAFIDIFIHEFGICGCSV